MRLKKKSLRKCAEQKSANTEKTSSKNLSPKFATYFSNDSLIYFIFTLLLYNKTLLRLIILPQLHDLFSKYLFSNKKKRKAIPIKVMMNISPVVAGDGGCSTSPCTPLQGGSALHSFGGTSHPGNS